MIMLNMKSGVPIFEQIRESIKKQILADILPPGEKLPSVRVLAGELGINPNTIQKAYTELESDGFVYTVSGKGVFVSEKNEGLLMKEQSLKLVELKKALENAREAGVSKEVILDLVEKEYTL